MPVERRGARPSHACHRRDDSATLWSVPRPTPTASCLPVALLVPIAALTFEAPVDAYLDPGSGSMLLQVLLGGFAAVGVVAKLYWHRLTGLFRRKELERDSR